MICNNLNTFSFYHFLFLQISWYVHTVYCVLAVNFMEKKKIQYIYHSTEDKALSHVISYQFYVAYHCIFLEDNNS